MRYLGGSQGELLQTMTMNTAGGIYLGGFTTSPDFPGESLNGRSGGSAAGFVTKLSADGSAVLSSRLLSCSVNALAPDGSGGVWAAGGCVPPTPTAFQSSLRGPNATASLVELPDQGPPAWASYIGGSSRDSITAIAVTAEGVALAGLTFSFDFPVNHAIQGSLHQRPDSEPVLADGFVMQFGGAMGPPAFSSSGVVNAASYRSGQVAPGTIISILGDDLATVVRSATALPLPQTLGDISVTVNGARAALIFVSPAQVNALVPLDAAVGTATLEVHQDGVDGAQQTVEIVPAAPGLFVTANGFAAINAPNFYVRAGDWITLYATGLGAVTSDSLPRVIAPVGVTIGDIPLAVTFAGLAPGFAGLYQVNTLLPADVGTGFRNLPAVIRVGDQPSNSGLVSVAGN